MSECPFCRNPTEDFWNFCRKCGAKIIRPVESKQVEVSEIVEIVKKDEESPTGVIYEVEEPIEIEGEEEEEVEKKELTDDELVERIAETIVKREKYNSLLKRKQELEGEVSKLLDRVKNKLIPAGEAKPKVKTLSSEIGKLTKTETEFEDFSAILPIEQIIEDRNNERQKYKRLQTLKGDKAISRGTYDEMEVKYKKNLEGLNMKLNIELTKMKKTFDALERKMKQLQRDLEILYVQSQTGELGEKAYQKSKVEKSSEIDRMKKVSQAVKAILSEAK